MASRRRFLKVLWAASAAASAGACGGESQGGSGFGSGAHGAGGGMEADLPEGFVLLGNVSGLPEGALVEAVSVELFVGRDAGGVYAMTSRCTHLNCNMINNEGIIVPGVIRCACHGSRFDAFGTPIMGPATAPLQHYAVAVDEGGNIGVDVSAPVDAAFRAPVIA